MNDMAASLSLAAGLAAAREGPMAAGQLVPLSNVGPLRITYNWLYSALNCDPNDTSPFTWLLIKQGEQTISLSPQQGYGGMTLYASVRDDLNYTVQVQAPFSADWITAVGGDETLTLSEHDLFVIALTGRNGAYLSVDDALTTHDDHSGYLVHSNASSLGPGARFYFVVDQVLQDIPLSPTQDLDPHALQAELAGAGAVDPAALAATIQSLA
jgi:hypothetical protein